MIKKNKLLLITVCISLLFLSGCIPKFEKKTVSQLNIDSCVQINYMTMEELDKRFEYYPTRVLKICDFDKCCVLARSWVGSCFEAYCVMLKK